MSYSKPSAWYCQRDREVTIYFDLSAPIEYNLKKINRYLFIISMYPLNNFKYMSMSRKRMYEMLRAKSAYAILLAYQYKINHLLDNDFDETLYDDNLSTFISSGQWSLNMFTSAMVHTVDEILNLEITFDLDPKRYEK